MMFPITRLHNIHCTSSDISSVVPHLSPCVYAVLLFDDNDDILLQGTALAVSSELLLTYSSIFSESFDPTKLHVTNQPQLLGCTDMFPVEIAAIGRTQISTLHSIPLPLVSKYDSQNRPVDDLVLLKAASNSLLPCEVTVNPQVSLSTSLLSAGFTVCYQSPLACCSSTFENKDSKQIAKYISTLRGCPRKVVVPFEIRTKTDEGESITSISGKECIGAPVFSGIQGECVLIGMVNDCGKDSDFVSVFE
ncbi:hypothetical protein GEMRC1_009441 [Eukaryota sp. GEM-RC1]